MWADEVERRRSEEKRRKSASFETEFDHRRQNAFSSLLFFSLSMPLRGPGGRAPKENEKHSSEKKNRCVLDVLWRGAVSIRECIIVDNIFVFFLFFVSFFFSVPKKMNPNSRRLTHTRRINPKMWFFFLVLPMRLMDIFCEINFQIFEAFSLSVLRGGLRFHFRVKLIEKHTQHVSFFIDSIAMEKEK